MTIETVSPSVTELLAWILAGRHTYAETMAAWTTHCPRLSAWEDALAAGLVEIRRTGHGESLVVLTRAGASLHDPPAARATPG
jgi:hypothetical protein